MKCTAREDTAGQMTIGEGEGEMKLGWLNVCAQEFPHAENDESVPSLRTGSELASQCVQILLLVLKQGNLPCVISQMFMETDIKRTSCVVLHNTLPVAC